MKDIGEDNITDEVLAAVVGGENRRVQEISVALIKHCHAFISEVEPTQAEWEAGIEFLTRVGQKCTDKRQEFILLSDTLGISMLVDAINHRKDNGATQSTVLGPFFVESRPSLPLGANMSEGIEGTPMFVSGRVMSEDGTPIPGAIVDAWHADEEGFYDVQTLDDLAMRGKFKADDEGHFWFWSVKPRAYPIPDDGPVGDMLKAQGRHPYRPEHVHFKIESTGFQSLTTHLFIDGDKYLDSDVVFGVKADLVTQYTERKAGAVADGSVCPTDFVELNYDFVLATDG